MWKARGRLSKGALLHCFTVKRRGLVGLCQGMTQYKEFILILPSNRTGQVSRGKL